MNTGCPDALWARVRDGKPVFWVGAGVVRWMPPDYKVVRLNCSVSWVSGGPLHRAYRQMRAWLGEEDASLPTRAEGTKLRVSFMEEVPLQLLEPLLVKTSQQVAETQNGHLLLWFDAVERADQSVFPTIRRLLLAEDALALPWVLCFHEPPQGEAALLLQQLTDRYGSESLITEGCDGFVSPAKFAWEELPAPVLRILRAGAVVGSSFEVEWVSYLTGKSVGEVLLSLQEAVDQGAPLVDYGSGHFFLPPKAVERLLHHLLPSLRAFWHERLALGLAEKVEQAHPIVGELAVQEVQEAPEHDVLQEDLTEEERARLFASLFASAEMDAPKVETESFFEDERAKEAALGERRPLVEKATTKTHAFDASLEQQKNARPKLHVPSEEENAGNLGVLDLRDEYPQIKKAADAAEKDSLATRRFPALKTTHFSKGRGFPLQERTRAAEHLREAGRLSEALEQYINAAREAMKVGESQRSLLLIQQAITLLEQMPISPSRSLLEARAFMELGRLQWLGTFPDATFSLQEALASLDAAEAALPFGSPAELMGELVSLKAGVSCDLGEMKTLERALQEITQISRQLLAEGQPLQAARLLNEQAAVYIRLGDPVQATHLLYRSRSLFEEILSHNPHDLTAQEESADTEHLLARLALHVPLRRGREEEAIIMSLEHARQAERWYLSHRRYHSLGRVLGTMGRLELKRGDLQKSQEYLVRALELQQQNGDLTGLARTHDALGHLFLLQGHESEALRVLASSIALNLEKGAPLGVAFNRRAFSAILQALQQRHAREQIPLPLQSKLEQVERLLHEAERVLGRVSLPRTMGA